VIAWVALILALLELCFLAAVVAVVVVFWRRVRPQVEPWLTMFGGGKT